jgi:PAS domain S-box-containing protein
MAFPAPVAYINRNRVYEYVNRAFLEFSERQPAEIQGRPLADISTPDDYARQAPVLERALAGETIAYERLATFEHRAPRWYQTRLVPERDAAGDVVGVFVLLNDIQSQKESEAAIRHINWVLNSHMENTPMAVMEWIASCDSSAGRAGPRTSSAGPQRGAGQPLSDWRFVSRKTFRRSNR